MNKKILICMLLVGLSCAYADNTKNTVSATGHGEVKVRQEVATMQFSLIENAKTPLEAQNKLRYDSDVFLKSLKNTKASKIETTSMSVSPIMSYTDNKPKVIGYTANSIISAKSSIEDAGGVIDKVMNSGISVTLSGTELSASDEVKAAGMIEAIRLATKDAKAKDEIALSAVNLKPAGIINISVQGNNYRPMPMANYGMMKTSNVDTSSMPATQIISGEDIISADVNVSMTY